MDFTTDIQGDPVESSEAIDADTRTSPLANIEMGMRQASTSTTTVGQGSRRQSLKDLLVTVQPEVGDGED